MPAELDHTTISLHLRQFAHLGILTLIFFLRHSPHPLLGLPLKTMKILLKCQAVLLDHLNSGRRERLLVYMGIYITRVVTLQLLHGFYELSASWHSDRVADSWEALRITRVEQVG